MYVFGIVNTSCIARDNIWLGGLFFPQGLLTATRQAAAKQLQWSVERLVLKVTIGGNFPKCGETSFVVNGLVLVGAGYKDDSLCALRESMMTLPSTLFEWVKDEDSKYVYCVCTFISRQMDMMVDVPVYLNHSRFNILLSILLPRPPTMDNETIFQRGVGLVASSLK